MPDGYTHHWSGVTKVKTRCSGWQGCGKVAWMAASTGRQPRELFGRNAICFFCVTKLAEEKRRLCAEFYFTCVKFMTTTSLPSLLVWPFSTSHTCVLLHVAAIKIILVIIENGIGSSLKFYSCHQKNDCQNQKRKENSKKYKNRIFLKPKKNKNERKTRKYVTHFWCTFDAVLMLFWCAFLFSEKLLFLIFTRQSKVIWATKVNHSKN